MGILDSLARTESGGNWGALNPYGYGGRLQFGTARLADAARAGVVPAGITGADFARMTPEQQMAVEQWHFADIDRQAQAQGLDRYIGQSVGGVPITQDAIRAMAHLGGIGGAARFLESGGAYNPADANGTSLLDYARTHGGAGSMQQPAVTMSAMNAPEPQQPRGLFERLAANNPGNGILGALADPDRRARLAIALEGMTLNPNDAFITTLMQDMQNRRDDRQIQRTVEMLTGMGRADLAEAVGAGALSPNDATAIALTPAPARELIEVNGQLVDPVTGDVVGDYRDPQGANVPADFVALDMRAQAAGLAPGSPEYQQFMMTNGQPGGGADQTANIRDYEYLRSQGVDDATAQEMVFGGGGTTINNNMGGGAFDEAFAKGDAQALLDASVAGLAAARNIPRINQLDDLLSAAPSGAGGALTQLAGEWGIQTEGLDAVQAAQAIINSLVPEQRPPGSGPMSDADLELFKQSLPRLINTREGNATIVQTLRAIAEYDAQAATIVQQLRSGAIDRATAFQMLQDRADPLAGFRDAAPAPTAPAAPSGVLTYNPVTGVLE